MTELNFNESLLTFDEVSPEVQQEVLRIAYNFGVNAGKQYRKLIQDGLLDVNQKVKFVLPAEEIDFSKFSLYNRFMMALGTKSGAETVNGGIAIMGLYTGLRSAGLHGTSWNPEAKLYYKLSGVCATAAIGSGGFAVYMEFCRIYYPAALAEMLGYMFLKLGQAAEERALQIERRNLLLAQREGRRSKLNFGTYNKRASFLFPVNSNPRFSKVIAKIPFYTIGRVVGFCITIYCYRKIIIRLYRFGQNMSYHYKIRKKIKAARILTASFNRTSFFKKQKQIYKFAIS